MLTESKRATVDEDKQVVLSRHAIGTVRELRPKPHRFKPDTRQHTKALLQVKQFSDRRNAVMRDLNERLILEPRKRAETEFNTCTDQLNAFVVEIQQLNKSYWPI
jgi:hypothetical protein